jgi:hypothetical protein
VDNRGRWISGLIGLAVALPFFILSTLAVVAPPEEADAWGPIGLSLVPAAFGLPIAVVQLARAVRGGLGEAFDVYEGGIVHHGWRTRSWTWEQIAMLPGRAGPGPLVGVAADPDPDRAVRGRGGRVRLRAEHRRRQR